MIFTNPADLSFKEYLMYRIGHYGLSYHSKQEIVNSMVDKLSIEMQDTYEELESYRLLTAKEIIDKIREI